MKNNTTQILKVQGNKILQNYWGGQVGAGFGLFVLVASKIR